MIQRINWFFRVFCLWASIVICFTALMAGLCMVVYGVYDAAMKGSILLDTMGL